MTVSLAVAPPPAPPPPIGTIIYLASYMLRVALSAEITPPDTPDMYSGQLKIMGDAGEMNTDPLMGPRGFPGQAQFPLRLQDTPIVNSQADLPTTLTNTQTDIGKYWEIDELDDEGVITGVQSWVWYGTSWRIIQMGSTGPPGPAPEITPSVQLIQPQPLPTYPDTTSAIVTSGGHLEPTWEFNLAVPAGPSGPVSPVFTWPDVNLTGIATSDLLVASGEFTANGAIIWKPFPISAFATQYFSVPESAFTAYTGISQQAAIGSFVLPPQPFPWTAVCWGHIGAGGVSLSTSPFKIGCEVLLGDPTDGTLVARGFGTTIGEVNIMPHYSTPGNKNLTLTPRNQYAMVPANHTDPAQGTIYINLWNDGQYGAYDFNPGGAQVFCLVMPLEQDTVFEPF